VQSCYSRASRSAKFPGVTGFRSDAGSVIAHAPGRMRRRIATCTETLLRLANPLFTCHGPSRAAPAGRGGGVRQGRNRVPQLTTKPEKLLLLLNWR
jgi:hypothetical protein